MSGLPLLLMGTSEVYITANKVNEEFLVAMIKIFSDVLSVLSRQKMIKTTNLSQLKISKFFPPRYILSASQHTHCGMGAYYGI